MKKEKLHEKVNFNNIRECIEWAGEHYAERYAYSFRETPRSEITRVSFPQLRDDVRALGSELLAMGAAGKHCALIARSSYLWAVTYFATLSIGAVLIPLDRDWTAEDLAETAAKADAELLICDSDLTEKAELVAKRLGGVAPIYVGAHDGVEALVERGRARFRENSAPYYEAPIDPNALALLVFTSGTTGKGKGVMLSQTNVISDMTDVVQYVDFGIKTVGVLPPHHTYGSSVMFLGHLIIGSEIYISSGLRYVQRELKEQKPEHLVLVPLYLETFYRRIMANIKEQGKEHLIAFMIRLSNALLKLHIDVRKKLFAKVREAFGGELKMAISGGAPINPEILHFFNAMGIGTLNGYGITECAPIIAVNRSLNIVEGSVGTVLDIDDVKIDEPNEDGEGEILVKGPNVMLGYYKDEEATREAFDEEGYFRTGDYGKLTDGRILFITGRKKNLIILSNGKNVYPEEIENELVAVPGVIDVVVYEGQSKRGSAYNTIVAEIFPDKEYVEKNGISDLRAHLQKYVDAYNRTAVPYKKIGALKVRGEEFPKNTMRKILRFKLDKTID